MNASRMAAIDPAGLTAYDTSVQLRAESHVEASGRWEGEYAPTASKFRAALVEAIESSGVFRGVEDQNAPIGIEATLRTVHSSPEDGRVEVVVDWRLVDESTHVDLWKQRVTTLGEIAFDGRSRAAERAFRANFQEALRRLQESGVVESHAHGERGDR